MRRDALACERHNLLCPGEPPKVPYVTRVLENQPYPIVAVSDYIKAVPDQIARWMPGAFHSLGTDGFGRSEARAELRSYFEIDAKYVTLAALRELARSGEIAAPDVTKAAATLGLDANKLDPTAAPTRDAPPA